MATKITYEKRIETLFASMGNWATKAHGAACEGLEHFALHGDVSKLNSFYKIASAAGGFAKAETFKAWAIRYGALAFDREGNAFKVKGKPGDTDIEGAKACVYFDYSKPKVEAEETPLVISDLLEAVTKLHKRLAKAADDGKVDGEVLAHWRYSLGSLNDLIARNMGIDALMRKQALDEARQQVKDMHTPQEGLKMAAA